MFEFHSLIKSMKLSWLKRMWTSNADWTIIARTELPDIEKLLRYGCTKLEFIQTKLTNPFYLNIVQAWIHYNRVYQPSTEEIISDTIWFSNWTKYATTVIRKWDDKGLRFIGDLYDQDTGIILPRQNLENTYGIRIHFLCYTSLIRCLPKAIRKGINITFLIKPIIPYTINQVLNDRKFPRLAYRAFVEGMGATTRYHKHVFKQNGVLMLEILPKALQRKFHKQQHLHI